MWLTKMEMSLRKGRLFFFICCICCKSSGFKLLKHQCLYFSLHSADFSPLFLRNSKEIRLDEARNLIHKRRRKSAFFICLADGFCPAAEKSAHLKQLCSFNKHS